MESALLNSMTMGAISDRLENYCYVNKIFYSERRKEVVITMELAGEFIGAEKLWMMTLKRKKIKMSLSSVYNVLNWLVKIGFAEKDINLSTYGMFRLSS
jgi:Fe2+ or Zn2+ uptake regulation protein